MERTRRLRTSNYMRDMVRENHVRIDELIYPIFVTEGENKQDQRSGDQSNFNLWNPRS